MTINDPVLCSSNIEILRLAGELERTVREGKLLKLGELYAKIHAASREGDWRVNELLRNAP